MRYICSIKNIYFDYFNAKVSVQNAEVLSYNIDVWDIMQQYTIRAFSGVFGHLTKNPVKSFTIEKRKDPGQKNSGITHPLSYKA